MNRLTQQGWTVALGLLLSVPSWSAETAQQQMKDAERVLSDLHRANEMEIHMGMMAKEKGAFEQVRAYGDQLVKDHQEADQQLQELAKKGGYTLSAATEQGMVARYETNKENTTLAELSKKTGAEFDKAFAAAMIADHKRDIWKLEKAQKELAQPDVRDFISKILPKLHEHLAVAQRLKKRS